MHLYIQDKISTIEFTDFCTIESVDITASYTYDESASFELMIEKSDITNINFIKVGKTLFFSEVPTDGTIPSELIFRGIISDVSMSILGSNSTVVTISCIGFETVLSRSVVSSVGTLSDVTCGYVVNLLVSQLSGDSITAGTLQDGAVLTGYDPFGKNVRQIVEDLAEVSGFVWWIDDVGALNFVSEYFTENAPKVLDSTFTDINSDTTVIIDDLEVNTTFSDFANKILLIGAIQTDGSFISSVKENATSINEMTSRYGNGVFAVTINNASITDQVQLDNTAQKLLDQLSVEKRELNFVSEVTSYKAGQILTVNVPECQITSDLYLIKNINYTLESHNKLRVAINAVLKTETVSSNNRKTWIDEFGKFVNKNNLPSNITNTFDNIYNQISGGTGGFSVNVLSLNESVNVSTL